MTTYFPDMTTEQIAALDEAAIDKAIKLACAEAGAKIFLNTSDPKPEPPAMPDVSIYSVGQWSFLDYASAEKLKHVIESLPRVTNRYNSKTYRTEQTYEPSITSVEISTSKLYSPEHFQQHKTALDLYETAMREWGSRDREREKAREAIDKITADVLREVYGAREKIEANNRIKRLFDEYLSLANGNRATAWRFLKRAENLSDLDVTEMNLVEVLPIVDLIPVPAEEPASV